MSEIKVPAQLKYVDRACVICNKDFVTSWYISLPTRAFFICPTCAKNLLAALEPCGD